jgi:hypothetical protein
MVRARMVRIVPARIVVRKEGVLERVEQAHECSFVERPDLAPEASAVEKS